MHIRALCILSIQPHFPSESKPSPFLHLWRLASWIPKRAKHPLFSLPHQKDIEGDGDFDRRIKRRGQVFSPSSGAFSAADTFFFHAPSSRLTSLLHGRLNPCVCMFIIFHEAGRKEGSQRRRRRRRKKSEKSWKVRRVGSQEEKLCSGALRDIWLNLGRRSENMIKLLFFRELHFRIVAKRVFHNVGLPLAKLWRREKRRGKEKSRRTKILEGLRRARGANCELKNSLLVSQFWFCFSVSLFLSAFSVYIGSRSCHRSRLWNWNT